MNKYFANKNNGTFVMGDDNLIKLYIYNRGKYTRWEVTDPVEFEDASIITGGTEDVSWDRIIYDPI